MKLSNQRVKHFSLVNWLGAQLQAAILCHTCRTPDLRVLHQSHSFLSTWRKFTLPRFGTLPVLDFLLQTDAMQQLAITGSLLYLLAWGPYILSLFGPHPMRAACLQHFDKVACRAAQVGGWEDSLRQTHLASGRKGALRCWRFTPTISFRVPWTLSGLKIILLVGWCLEF